MDACNIDEIQNLFIYYSACFSKYFPELGFYCNGNSRYMVSCGDIVTLRECPMMALIS